MAENDDLGFKLSIWDSLIYSMSVVPGLWVFFDNFKFWYSIFLKCFWWKLGESYPRALGFFGQLQVSVILIF